LQCNKQVKSRFVVSLSDDSKKLSRNARCDVWVANEKGAVDFSTKPIMSNRIINHSCELYEDNNDAWYPAAGKSIQVAVKMNNFDGTSSEPFFAKLQTPKNADDLRKEQKKDIQTGDCCMMPSDEMPRAQVTRVVIPQDGAEPILTDQNAVDARSSAQVSSAPSAIPMIAAPSAIPMIASPSVAPNSGCSRGCQTGGENAQRTRENLANEAFFLCLLATPAIVVRIRRRRAKL
jgi:hypothetical protein